MTLDGLYAELARRGLVAAASVPPLDAPPVPSPWYVRLLLGFMGWVGGLFVLGFFGLLIHKLFEWTAGMALISAALFTCSYTVYRHARGNDFAEQAALAASICAQALAVAALGQWLDLKIDRELAWIACGLQIVLAVAMPNALHRLLSTFFAALAALLAVRDAATLAVVCAMLGFGYAFTAQREEHWIATGKGERLLPIQSGLALALLAAGAMHLPLVPVDVLPARLPWSALVFGAALLWWTWEATRTRVPRERAAALLGAALLSLVAWRVPGLIAAALVLLASYGKGRRAMAGAAVVALIANLSSYYYSLHATLLEKAISLALAGLVLLLAAIVQRRIAQGAGA
jgi:hypothetical protein